MNSIAVIENKISAAKKYFKILDRYKKIPFSEIMADVDKKGALERYLYLASQAAIDLADSVIAQKKLRKPSSMSESFYILNEEGLISNELTEKLVSMTGFRNVIAHDYEKVNYDIVENVLHSGLKDIEEFLKLVIDHYSL
jgi:uncharacterized protein YutE (UPF0331/DUF86 family)